METLLYFCLGEIMKFVKLVVCTTVVLSTVVAWEQCRDYVLEKIDRTDAGLENIKLKKNIIQISDVNGVSNDSEDSEKYNDANETEDENNQSKNEKTDENNLVINFEKGFEDIAKNAMHSVVNVATMQLVETGGSGRIDIPDVFRGGPFDDLFKDFFNFPQKKSRVRKANALGSGFIIKVTKDFAYIVTNNHVVEKAKKVVVFLSDKTELPAKIHATDARTDIAVLSVSLKNLDINRNKLVPMQWGDSSKLHEGNFVVAIGNPFGLGSTVTHGIVSATGRNIAMGKNSMSLTDNFIQHSAAINMGNSGGALLNTKGKVIGINNAIFSTSGGNIGIGFAIPSNLAKITVDQLIEHKRTFRGWLGAEVHAVGSKQAESVGLITKSPLDSSKVYGAYVAKLVKDGPAEKAGIKVGDIIIEFNGKRITENCSLQMAVGTTKINSSAKVKVWRLKEGGDWGAVELTAKVGDYEQAIKDGEIETSDAQEDRTDDGVKEATIDSLGITVTEIPEKMKKDYPKEVKVVVSSVDEEKITSFYGSVFNPGDGFISADNKKITSVSQLKKIMQEAEKKTKKTNTPIPFVVVRDGSQMMIATTLEHEKKEKNEK